MTDQWYFEIGDGNTYGPYPLEKLQKWAAAGNLMPIEEDLTRRIVANCDEVDVADYMNEQRISRLNDDAVDTLLAGTTSLQEILTVLNW